MLIIQATKNKLCLISYSLKWTWIKIRKNFGDTYDMIYEKTQILWVKRMNLFIEKLDVDISLTPFFYFL